MTLTVFIAAIDESAYALGHSKDSMIIGP